MTSAPRLTWRNLAAASLCLTLVGTGGGLALLSAQPTPTELPLPRGYVCYRTATPLNIDGKLDEKAWLDAPWTDDFVDIEGSKKPKPRFRTRAKMLWDDKYFYIGAELEEPHVWATLTEHDAVIFHDNDFEIFIDPNGDNHNYAEFEMNALNTGWDLLLTKPYKDGGKPIDSWEIPGLEKAVHIEGTLNEPGDRDRNWTVELAFPWKVLGQLATHPGAPKNGDQWRVNFSRVEWQIDIVNGRYRKVPDTLEDNWVWSPQGVVDMHRPETWGYVQFSTGPFGKTDFRPDVDLATKQRLHEVYYAQRAFRKKNGRWAANLAELGPTFSQPAGAVVPTLEAGRFGFTASLPSLDKAGPAKTWQIRYDGLLWNSLEDERSYGADSKP